MEKTIDPETGEITLSYRNMIAIYTPEAKQDFDNIYGDIDSLIVEGIDGLLETGLSEFELKQRKIITKEKYTHVHRVIAKKRSDTRITLMGLKDVFPLEGNSVE